MAELTNRRFFDSLRSLRMTILGMNICAVRTAGLGRSILDGAGAF